MSAFEAIRDRLGDRVVSTRSGQVEARCPAHEDRRASLGLGVRTQGDPGAVACCQAGCDIEAVMAALDLPTSALFDRHWQAQGSNGHRGIVAAYPYTDESGELLYEAVRYVPKGFSQRRPDGRGGWIGDLNGTRRVLYRLPRVIEAVSAGRRVWLAEGEKDVHALEAAGEVATCNPMGAGKGKWRDEYAQVLVGAEVVVVADRDDAGRKHAETVRASLQAVAGSVRVVEAIVGKDAADHLAAGRGVDEFKVAAIPATSGPRDRPPKAGIEAQETPANTEDSPPADDSGHSGHPLGGEPNGPNPKSLLIDMREAMDTAAQGFVFPLYPVAARGFLTLLAGRHSSRKTWLMLLAGVGIHSGASSVAGMDCTQTPVLYVDAENGPRLMGKRFRDAGVAPDGLLVADGTRLALPKDLALLGELIVETGAGLVVLDSLRRLTPGKRENESDDMGPAVGAIANLARTHDCAIVLIHHRSSKDGAAPTRGSSAIEDQADVVFTLDRRTDDVSVLHAAKYRIDAEPPDLGVRFVSGFGTMRLESADTPAASKPQPRSAGDELAGRVRLLADAVRADTEAKGWTPSKLAGAVDRKPGDRAFKEAMDALMAAGEWVAEGETRNRRYRPTSDES